MEFFVIIASTGKYGYSLSHNVLNQTNLPKIEHHFGNSFVLLNSKMFKTQKGFDEIAKTKLNLFERFINLVLSKITKV